MMIEQHSEIVRKQLGQRIRQLRLAKGMSLRAFAKKIGSSNTYMSNIETGKQAATVNLLDRIARGLDVEIRDLF